MKINVAKIKRKAPGVIGYLVRYAILLGFAYVLVYPFLFMIINSVKNPTDWYDPTVVWVPKAISFQSILAAGEFTEYWQSLYSTILNGVIPALISVISCAVAGYGLARFDFKGKKILMVIMILFIMIPDPLIMIPSYDNFRHLDFLGILNFLGNLTGYELRPSILDSPLVFIIPAIFATGIKNGLFIYIYTQFFKGLPKELEEAAWIDGAGPWKTFLKIVMPSSGSATVTVIVFSVVWYWNDYYQSAIYLSQKFPLSVVISGFEDNMVKMAELNAKYSFTAGSLLLSCCLISIIPILIFFLIMQRRFVRSIATCGIVG